MSTGYDFDQRSIVEQLVRMEFPERNQYESAIIADFLKLHYQEYDRYSISVRVGRGLTPDATHLPGVQANTIRGTQKRIDMMAWQGLQPFIFEVKVRVAPYALGQLLTYRHLWLEDNPDALEPRLVVIARVGDPDTERVLEQNGVDVYIFESTDDSGGDAGSGVPPDNAAPA